MKDPFKLKASEVIIQFPYTLPVTEEKTEEELARIAEKRKEQGYKLQEMAAKKRTEKVDTNLSVHVALSLTRIDSFSKKKMIYNTSLFCVNRVQKRARRSGL